MSEPQQVVQRIREQLERQIRAGDQLKSELADAFSLAAEGLLDRQAAELSAVAENLRQNADDLARLLEDLARTDAQVRELTEETRELGRRTEGVAQRLESTVSGLEAGLTGALTQRFKELDQGLAQVQKDLAGRADAMRGELGGVARTAQQTLEQSQRLYTDLASFAKTMEASLKNISKLLESGFANSKKALGELQALSLERQESGEVKIEGRMKALEGRLQAFELDSRRRNDSLNRMAGLTLLLLILFFLCMLGVVLFRG